MSLNLVLNAPFDIEFDRMTGIPEFPEEFIANYLDAGSLPAMSDRYYFRQIGQIYWNQIYEADPICSQVNPGDQLSLEDVKTCIGKKEKKTTNHPLVTKPSHSDFNP